MHKVDVTWLKNCYYYDNSFSNACPFSDKTWFSTNNQFLNLALFRTITLLNANAVISIDESMPKSCVRCKTPFLIKIVIKMLLHKVKLCDLNRRLYVLSRSQP